MARRLRDRYPGGLYPLAGLPQGTRAVVVAVRGGHALQRRMAIFGFTPGTQVEILQNAGVGPLLVRLQHMRVALGRGEAAHIWVRPLDGPNSSPRAGKP